MRRAGLLIAVLVVTGAGAACDDLPVAAVTVNGEEVSQSTVDDDLRALRDNEILQEAASQSPVGELARSPGTINSAFTADWMTLLVQSEVVDQELSRLGIEVTNADRREGRQQAEQAFGSPEALAEFPESFRDRLVDRLAGFVALQAEVDSQEAFGELLADADVDVDPRYGRWSSEELVVQPPSRT